MKKRHCLLKKLAFLVTVVGASCGLIFSSAPQYVESIKSSFSQTHDTGTSDDIYRFNYENDLMSFYFNADVNIYRRVTRNEISSLKSSFLHVLREAVFDDVDLINEISDSGLLKAHPKKLVLPHSTGIDVDILANLVVTQLTDENGNPDEESIRVYAEDENGIYKLITSYYVQRYVQNFLSLNPTVNPLDVFEDVEYVVCITATPYLNGSAYKQDVIDNIEESVETAKTEEIVIDIENAKNIFIVIEDAISKDPSISITEFITSLGEETVGQEVTQTLTNATGEQMTSFLTSVSTSAVAEIFEKIKISSSDVLNIVEAMGINNMIEFASQVNLGGMREIFSSVEGLASSDLTNVVKQFIDNITIQDALQFFKEIKIDGHTIFNNSSFKKDGIKYLLQSLPKAAQIKNWSDEQFKLRYHIDLETSFGHSSFDAEIGLFGDCTLFRRLAEIIDETIDLSVDDGVINLNINLPQAFTRIVQRLCNSSILGDDLKHELFDFIFSTVDEQYNRIHEKTLADYIYLLKDIDYETAISTFLAAEELNELLGTDKVTNERIDKAINGFMSLVHIGAEKISSDKILDFLSQFIDLDDAKEERISSLIDKVSELLLRIDEKNIDADLLRSFADPSDSEHNQALMESYIDNLSNYQNIFDRIQNLITKVYNKLPMSVRSKSLMDYYIGNGEFAYANTFEINFEKIFTTLLKEDGKDIYDAISSFFGEGISTLSINLTGTVKDFYKVTYQLSETETKVGALPVDADVPFFANCENNQINGRDIVKWVDANGNQITSMPKQDITVYPALDFSISTSADIDQVYDGSGSIFVTAEPSDSYTYQWYKNGSPVAGATSYSLDTVNVADSGSYYCEVTSGDGFLTKTSSTISVNIVKAEVEIPEEDPTTFTYDTTEHSYNIVENDEFYSIDGTTSATNAGDYSLTLSLVDPDNYEWENGTIDDIKYDWSIAKAIVAKPSDSTIYTYDGSEQNFAIVDTDEYQVTGTNSATNAGAYEVTISLKDSSNYVWDDETSESFSLVWTINKAEIDVSGIEWDYTSAFTYDGKAHTVSLKEDTVPNYVEIDTITNNSQINANRYVASVSMKTTNDNYVIVGSVDSLTWYINRAIVSLPEEDLTVYTYNGDEQTYVVASSDLYEILGNSNKATNAGSYVVSIHLKDSANYQWEDGTTDDVKFVWSIAKAKVNEPIDSSTYVYDGTAQTFALSSNDLYTVTGQTSGTNVGTYIAIFTLKDANNYVWFNGSTSTYELPWEIEKAIVDVPADSTISYVYDGTVKSYDITSNDLYTVVGGTAIDAGSYSVVIRLNDKENYEWSNGGTNDIVRFWTIEKSEIIIGELKWAIDEVTYDGFTHTNTVTNIPINVNATYSGDYQATNVGTFTAVVTLTPINDNYYISGNTTFTKVWTIKEGQHEEGVQYQIISNDQDQSGNPYGIVDCESGIPIDYRLNTILVELELGNLDDYDWASFFGDKQGYIDALYEINVVDGDGNIVHINIDENGNIIDENITFVVKLLIPEEYVDNEITVVYLGEDGTLQNMNAHKEGKYMVFETQHFSRYALVESEAGANITVPTWIFYLIIGLLVVVVVQLLLFIILVIKTNKANKDKKNDDEESTSDKNENSTEETKSSGESNN